MLVQQIDFLETILEETSDDLQSDSDRSVTTYWLGSDSETESVIHIKTKQRSAGKKPPTFNTIYTGDIVAIVWTILYTAELYVEDYVFVKSRLSLGAKIAGIRELFTRGCSTFSFLSAP